MVTLKLLKKIRDKLDDYIEEREQARERRRSYNPATSSSWSPDPIMEERTRRKSYDDKYRRHTSPDPVKRKTIGVSNDSRAKKNRRTNQEFSSEDNLANTRRSRDVVINQGHSSRDRSPRMSDSVLLRNRPGYQGRAGRSSEDNKRRASNERINRPRQIPSPLPLKPVQWAGLPRNNRPLSPLAVPQIGQQSYSITGPQQAQPPVDWDTYVRERNKKERQAATAEIMQDEEKQRAEASKWKATKETRSEGEQENAAQRKREEARIRKAAEREKAEKRRKAQKAEKRASDDRVKRENERRRLLAFGPPPCESEQQPRQSMSSTPIISDSGSQARQVERCETAPVQQRTAADKNKRQLQDVYSPSTGQQIKNTARQDSAPITPRKKDNSVQNMPPEFAPLTEENLRAQAGSGDDDLDPLCRGLGDNMRTILEGFRLPTIFQSDLTPSDEEENPLIRDKDKEKDE